MNAKLLEIYGSVGGLAKANAEQASAASARIAGVVQDGYRLLADGLAYQLNHTAQTLGGASKCRTPEELATLQREWLEGAASRLADDLKNCLDLTGKLLSEVATVKLPTADALTPVITPAAPAVAEPAAVEPVIEAAPAVEEIPAVAAEEAPAVLEAPAVVEETAPVEPVIETAPVIEEAAPAVEEIPAVAEEIPAVETVAAPAPIPAPVLNKSQARAARRGKPAGKPAPVETVAESAAETVPAAEEAAVETASAAVEAQKAGISAE